MPVDVAVDGLLPAERLCILWAGIFFMTALLTGVWKWRCMAATKTGDAPRYVNIAHRSSLLYTFAALTLGKFSTLNRLSNETNVHAVSPPLAFFALSIGSYIIHGVLGDTNNQIAKPRLGSQTLPRWLTPLFMWTLVVAEIGGFAVLFGGFIHAAYMGG
jgi:hypothetical protein